MILPTSTMFRIPSDLTRRVLPPKPCWSIPTPQIHPVSALNSNSIRHSSVTMAVGFLFLKVLSYTTPANSGSHTSPL